MNIFVTDANPTIAATHHCLIHLRKMPTELAQMLSTAHRILDGKLIKVKVKKQGMPDKFIDFYSLPTDRFNKDGTLKDTLLYKTTHTNHPCTKWVRETEGNYRWAWMHYKALCTSFYRATGNVHRSSVLIDPLMCTPHNITRGKYLTQFEMCMPNIYKGNDPIQAYQRFLSDGKFADWLTRKPPLPVIFPFGTPKWFDGERQKPSLVIKHAGGLA